MIVFKIRVCVPVGVQNSLGMQLESTLELCRVVRGIAKRSVSILSCHLLVSNRVQKSTIHERLVPTAVDLMASV